ncbi:hypothetical protein LOAG_02615 [Loa loa]|uniref:Uncharacterized protein n=1 Tax=Loa loa TaxID=7209 RepID=A0A1S0U648_LOALO|nr:hypothetical protein LOAG_02615 [Loa loa]EFO25875.1 hypothetical protein LOAG_02615 [Loa loa]
MDIITTTRRIYNTLPRQCSNRWLEWISKKEENLIYHQSILITIKLEKAVWFPTKGACNVMYVYDDTSEAGIHHQSRYSESVTCEFAQLTHFSISHQKPMK